MIQSYGCEVIQQCCVMTLGSIRMRITGASSLRQSLTWLWDQAATVTTRAMNHSSEHVRRAAEEAWEVLAATEVTEQMTQTFVFRNMDFQCMHCLENFERYPLDSVSLAKTTA
jgi:predicted N-acyltransferase